MDFCFNCGRPADTRDHVPPKGVFPRPRPTTLITVPACKTCNELTKLQDEYFRWLVATVGDATPEAVKLIGQRILPRFREKPALLREIMKGARQVDVYSPGGIWVGREPAFEYDRGRIQPVVEKTVKGLYFHEFGQRLEMAVVKDFVLNPKIPEENIPAVAGLPLRDVAPGVFGYRFYCDPNEKRASLWLLMFFEKTLFFTITEQNADGNEKGDVDQNYQNCY